MPAWTVKTESNFVRTRQNRRLNQIYDLEAQFGKQLAPTLFVFHVQLLHRSWWEKQWRYNAKRKAKMPNLTLGVDAYKLTNSLSWVPAINNVPALMALRSADNPSAPTTGGSGTTNTS